MTRFPANESPRIIRQKSSFYLPAFEISRSCRTASGHDDFDFQDAAAARHTHAHLSELALQLRRSCSHTALHRALERLAAMLLQGGGRGGGPTAVKCASAVSDTPQRGMTSVSNRRRSTTLSPVTSEPKGHHLPATSAKKAAEAKNQTTAVLPHRRRNSAPKGGGGWSDNEKGGDWPPPPPMRKHGGGEDRPLSEAEFKAVVAAMQALHGI